MYLWVILTSSYMYVALSPCLILFIRPTRYVCTYHHLDMVHSITISTRHILKYHKNALSQNLRPFEFAAANCSVSYAYRLIFKVITDCYLIYLPTLVKRMTHICIYWSDQQFPYTDLVEMIRFLTERWTESDS
jgi:hypothetical protein